MSKLRVFKHVSRIYGDCDNSMHNTTGAATSASLEQGEACEQAGVMRAQQAGSLSTSMSAYGEKHSLVEGDINNRAAGEQIASALRAQITVIPIKPEAINLAFDYSTNTGLQRSNDPTRIRRWFNITQTDAYLGRRS